MRFEWRVCLLLWMAPRVDASCSAGFEWDSTEAYCRSCVGGKYKDAIGNHACTVCPVATYSNAAAGATGCVACPSDSQCVHALSPEHLCNQPRSCICNAGYYGDAAAGIPCRPCPPNTGSVCIPKSGYNCVGIIQCLSNPGHYGQHANAGTPCPPGAGSNCFVPTAPRDTMCLEATDCLCNAGYSHAGDALGNLTKPYSISDCFRFVALIPSKPSFSSAGNRANAGRGTLPTFHAAGGPSGKGHVSFDRTLSQYLDTGPRDFHIATNGGFTIVMVLRLTGTAVPLEMQMNMWSAASPYELFIGRYNLNGQLRFVISNGGTSFWWWALDYVVAQDTWATVVMTYSASKSQFSFTINGIGSVELPTPKWNDKTLDGHSIGTAPFFKNYGFNGDIAGAFVVDEFLSQNATAEIADAMKQGVDLTEAVCPSVNECRACAASTYKASSGSASCAACPDGLVSAAGSAQCGCGVGHQLDATGGACVPCAAGTYKDAIGSASCSACPGGTYENRTASVACAACPANSGAACFRCTSVSDCDCDAGFGIERP